MQKRQVAAEAAVFDQTNLLPKRQLITVLCALAASMFITFVDQNGISVALPTIGEELHAEETISWAGTSALIANTIFQVLYGRLSDLFGRKSVFLSALALLAVSELLCGFSQNATMLFVFRGFAGVANGGITALTMMIVSDIVTLKERGKYQGILGSCVGAGSMAGPFIAAAFTQPGTRGYTSWRGFFWLVSPLAAIVGIMAYYILPTPKNAPPMRFKAVSKEVDYSGIVAGSAAIILLLIPISEGGSYFRWDSPLIVSMLTVGGCCMIGFVLVEKYVARLPMIPLSLFTLIPVCIMLVQNLLFGIVYYSQLYYLPLFFQNAHQLSPLTSAALLLPMTGIQMVASILSGLYISWKGRYGEVIWLGFFCWTLGVGLTCMFDIDTPKYAMALILLIEGVGIGCIFQPMLVALQAHCPKAQRAVVISNRNFIRALGGAIGLAISATIMQNTLQQVMPAEFATLSQMAYHTPDLNTLGATPSQKQDILQAYAQASRSVFIMNTPFIGLCLLGCLLIKDHGLQRSDEVELEKPSAHLSDQTLAQDVELGPQDSSDPTIAQEVGTTSNNPFAPAPDPAALELPPRVHYDWKHPLDLHVRTPRHMNEAERQEDRLLRPYSRVNTQTTFDTTI